MYGVHKMRVLAIVVVFLFGWFNSPAGNAKRVQVFPSVLIK